MTGGWVSLSTPRPSSSLLSLPLPPSLPSSLPSSLLSPSLPWKVPGSSNHVTSCSFPLAMRCEGGREGGKEEGRGRGWGQGMSGLGFGRQQGTDGRAERGERVPQKYKHREKRACSNSGDQLRGRRRHCWAFLYDEGRKGVQSARSPKLQSTRTLLLCLLDTSPPCATLPPSLPPTLLSSFPPSLRVLTGCRPKGRKGFAVAAKDKHNSFVVKYGLKR